MFLFFSFVSLGLLFNFLFVYNFIILKVVFGNFRDVSWRKFSFQSVDLIDFLFGILFKILSRACLETILFFYWSTRLFLFLFCKRGVSLISSFPLVHSTLWGVFISFLLLLIGHSTLFMACFFSCTFTPFHFFRVHLHLKSSSHFH